MQKLINLMRRQAGVVKFLVVGVTASIVHGAISWIFYYHILSGQTILSTLIGYGGGWICSYTGNRLWSFRSQTHELPVVTSFSKFILSQLVCMCILLSTTWLTQQLIILYFWWYIITNHLCMTPELAAFSAGASYPPALLSGMFFAALVSYVIMKKFVFTQQSSSPEHP